jgi:Polyketide cyclase / dehydrase and lipid transport
MDINRPPETQVAARPENVWDVLSNIGGWPRWNKDVKSAKLQAPVAVGSSSRKIEGPR